MSTKTVSLAFRGEMRKWDVIRVSGSKDEGIVIGVEKISGHSCMTVYPYKRKKTWFGRWFFMKWLKLRIWLKIIKAK